MNQLTRYVGFDRHQVAVHSQVPEILAGLEQNFRYMLQDTASHLVDSLEAGFVDGAYYLRNQDSSWKNETFDGILYYLNTEVVLRLVQTRADLIWLHAGAAAWRGQGVLVSGQSGRGKSTIIASLCGLGWQFLSDDIAPWDPQASKLWPFPQTPMFRPHPGVDIPADNIAELSKVVADIGPADLCREPVPVSALIFPQYTPRQEPALVPCSPATAALELLQNCFNFPVYRDQTFHHLCNLVKPLPAYRLLFHSGDQAARLLAKAYAGGFRGAQTG
jgi:hypothetical protein